MILFGIEYKGDLIYSIDRHDFSMSEDKKAGMDGGQFDYHRYIGEACEGKLQAFAVPYTYAELKNAYINNKKIKFKVSELTRVKIPLSKKNKKIHENDRFVWGTHGVNGDQPIKYKMMWELDTSHLKAILKTQMNISLKHREKIINILDERIKNPSLDPNPYRNID